MKRVERFDQLSETLRAAFLGMQAGIYTALPGIIVSFNEDEIVCVVQPAIQAQVTRRDGSKEFVDLPQLIDVPVIFPRGGGFTLTFPVARGDEALILIASRCIDNWWQLGGMEGDRIIPRSPAEIRMHNLSDGFALVGPFSQKTKIADVSTDSAQLRSDDGTAFVEIGPGSAVRVETTGDINLKGANVKIEGTASLELKCNHGFVWVPAHIDTYQNGIASTAHAPPAP